MQLSISSRASCAFVRGCSRPSCTRAVSADVRRVRVISRAGSKDDEPMAGMSTEEAVKILGVPSTASFDEILSRKNVLLSEAGSDQEKAMDIESAYDVIFMQSMRRRLTGEVQVSTTVRYADVPAEPPRRGPSAKRGSTSSSSSSKTLSLPTLPGGATIAIQKPQQQVAVQQGAVFGTLALWSLIQATLESPEAQMADTAGLQLSFALAYAVYSLKENKKMGLGKAVGMSLAALIVCALLGTAVQNWLRVDIVPLGAFQSPGIFCTEFVIVGLLLSCLFLV